MAIRRGRRRFEPAGNLRPGDLPLPARLAKALAVAHAWQQVAGAGLASRAPVEDLSRGVLTLREPPEPWTAMFRELAPRLVARMVEAHPELAIRTYRFASPGGSDAAQRIVTRPARSRGARRATKTGDPD